MPLWVLDLPIQKLHIAHNRLTSLLPEKGARDARVRPPARPRARCTCLPSPPCPHTERCSQPSASRRCLGAP